MRVCVRAYSVRVASSDTWHIHQPAATKTVKAAKLAQIKAKAAKLAQDKKMPAAMQAQVCSRHIVKDEMMTPCCVRVAIYCRCVGDGGERAEAERRDKG